MIKTTTSTLHNLGVLVTRPEHQSQHFIDLLEQAGARVFPFPTLDIQPLAPDNDLQQKLARIQDYAIVIFISPNAVNYALKHIDVTQLNSCMIGAIGKSTQKSLREYGVEVDLLPESGFTTDHMLELKSLQKNRVNNKRVLIFRGEGGREKLAQTLSSRGAIVDYGEVYRRTIPETDNGPILEKWADGDISLVTVTSNQTLENLYHILGKQGKYFLNTTPLIVPGMRCFEYARTMGHTGDIQIAHSALDMDMFQAILDWQAPNNR